MLLDLDGWIVEVNEYASRRFGFTREELVERPVWQLPSFRTDERWAKIWRERLQLVLDQGSAEFEDELEVSGNPQHVTKARLSTIRDEDDVAVGFAVEAEDVTAARLAAVVAQEQERLLWLVFDQSFQLTAVLSPEGLIREVNGGIGRTGHSREEIIGQPIEALAAGTLQGLGPRAELWAERLAAIQRATAPLHYFDVIDAADGTVDRAVDIMLTPVRDGDRLDLILMELRDQTEQYVAEDRWRVSEERLRVLINSIPHMVWSATGIGLADYLSVDWAEFSGRRVKDLLLDGWTDLVHPDDLQQVMEAWEDARQTGVFETVCRIRRHDGVYRWIDSHGQPTRDEHGGVVRWFGASLDITERREAEALLREQEERLRSALEVSGLGSYVLSLRPGVRSASDSNLNELMGMDVAQLWETEGWDPGFAKYLHPDDRQRVLDLVQSLNSPERPRDLKAEYRFLRPSPSGPDERLLSVVGRADYDDDGPVRLIGVVEDVTDRKRSMEAGLRSQKLEAIGTLASGIAHDVNNVMGAILSYARVAEAELAAGESPAESIGEIARGALRAGDVVQRLLAYARFDEPQRRSFDLAAVVAEAESLMRATLPADVALETTFAPNLPPLFGDATQVHQMVVNLITNAAQALNGDGGHIELRVEPVAYSPRLATEFPELRPGPLVRLSVRDDGTGIDDAVIRRIFDPFFTTKAPGEGTGLGLSAVQSVVRNHHGAIGVTSSPGHGAEFTAYFPVDEEAATATATAAAEVEPAAAGSEGLAGEDGLIRVLFVDDEPAFVRLARRALPPHGCVVSGHSDPAAALAEFEAAPAAFDALVTDLAMPGLTGLELAERVRALRPDLPIVLTSGYMGADEHRQAELAGVDAVIPKPSPLSEVARELRRLLAR